MRQLFFTGTAAFALAAATVQAAPETYRFDPDHTSIQFYVSHAGFSNMVGEFHGYDGRLTLDEENPASSRIELTIQPGSVDTDVDALDAKLISKDFFNVEAYPNASFTSTKVEVTGEKTARVTGDLTLMGQTHPVTLDVTLNKLGENQWSKVKTAGFMATASLQRSEWGLTEWLPAVGDEVRFVINTELQKLDAVETAPAETAPVESDTGE